jgi:DNA invertase Pin-like site-specific DNA recombinase
LLSTKPRFSASLGSAVPAAQYVRMSDETQQYSFDNQKRAIQEYASQHGFTIVKTYADSGKSGVEAKHRAGLWELLKDVVGGQAHYKAILVYDISRWGRFPNNDEAAHYEFICASSGVPLHYCAEPFMNDGSASSSILKALKRSMAAEYSRELGEKIYRGQVNLVQLGFWVAGPAGYGYRRCLISADGKIKQVLKEGEQKNIKTDRIKLVLGPEKEVEGVRMIFSMAADGHSCTDIARALNSKKILLHGREWNINTVHSILTNPKYTGCSVWHRHTQRMRTPLRPVEPQYWITKPHSFPPIVDQETFDCTQATLRKIRDSRWSREKLLKRIRRLLKAKGRLSERLLIESRSLPSTSTIRKYFGTYRQLYDLLGYDLEPKHVFRAEQGLRSARLRQALGDEIKALFSENVVVQLPRRGERSILRIDDTFMVSMSGCSFANLHAG